MMRMLARPLRARASSDEEAVAVAEELAIKGGPKAVGDGMVKDWPPITDEDRQAVVSVLDSGYLHGTGAPQARALQREWAEYVGVKHCLVTNSGTSALHMAVAAAGIQPGDEVLVPAYTYWASAAAVLHHNAIPVFVDIELETFCIDPALIEERITDHTRAVMPVHIAGMPADMDRISAIAKKHGLVVIEDAAQAQGAEYKGKKVGGLGDAAGFSLNRSKNLTSCEGGLYTTNNDLYHDYAKMMREFGEVIIPGEKREYNAYTLGWMYRSIEFANAFGRSQLKRLDQYNAQRIQMAEYLSGCLRQIPGVEPVACPPDRRPVYWTYNLEFRADQLGLDLPAEAFRTAAEQALRAEGMDIGQWQFMPVPAQDVFQSKTGYGRGCPWSCRFSRPVEYRAEDYPRTLEFLKGHTCLRGVYPPNELALMRRYVAAFEKVLSRPDALVEIAKAEVAA
jgi:dTDP-4-amino-4,6-dideoxygalactose transaminase